MDKFSAFFSSIVHCAGPGLTHSIQVLLPGKFHSVLVDTNVSHRLSGVLREEIIFLGTKHYPAVYVLSKAASVS